MKSAYLSFLIRRRTAWLGLLLASSLHSLASAFEERSRYSLALEGGLAAPLGPAEFSDAYDGGSHLGARVRQDLSEHWSTALSFSNQNHSLKTDHSSRLRTQPILFMGYYSFVRTHAMNPYFALGLGFSRNSQKKLARDVEWTKLSAAAGFGVEWNVGALNTVGVEALYRQYGRASQNDKNFQTATVSFLVHFYIPEAWIPDRPRKPLITAPQVEAPAPAAVVDASIKQQAQQELNQVQQDIFDKKMPPILFEPGQAALLESSFETLDIVGTILRRYPQFTVRVEGHTDDVGDEAQNVVLSQARAEAVRSYLVQNFTIPPEKISAAGFGEALPIAPNDSDENRARNRRVDFKIIQ
jgi:outer membrane protein OmpA-like peptidoglycan-associated protein